MCMQHGSDALYTVVKARQGKDTIKERNKERRISKTNMADKRYSSYEYFSSNRTETKSDLLFPVSCTEAYLTYLTIGM